MYTRPQHDWWRDSRRLALSFRATTVIHPHLRIKMFGARPPDPPAASSPLQVSHAHKSAWKPITALTLQQDVPSLLSSLPLSPPPPPPPPPPSILVLHSLSSHLFFPSYIFYLAWNRLAMCFSMMHFLSSYCVIWTTCLCKYMFSFLFFFLNLPFCHSFIFYMPRHIYLDAVLPLPLYPSIILFSYPEAAHVVVSSGREAEGVTVLRQTSTSTM